MSDFSTLTKNDTLDSLIVTFLLTTWIFCPRKLEYKNMFKAWIIFLISEFIIMAIFAPLFLFKIISDVSNAAFNAIYWIAIGLAYCIFVQVIRTTLEKKVIPQTAKNDYWQTKSSHAIKMEEAKTKQISKNPRKP